MNNNNEQREITNDVDLLKEKEKMAAKIKKRHVIYSIIVLIIAVFIILYSLFRMGFDVPKMLQVAAKNAKKPPITRAVFTCLFRAFSITIGTLLLVEVSKELAALKNPKIKNSEKFLKACLLAIGLYLFVALVNDILSLVHIGTFLKKTGVIFLVELFLDAAILTMLIIFNTKIVNKASAEILTPASEIKTGEVILSIKNLEVQFSVRKQMLTAIRDVSLDLYKGEILAIVGESGSGKSVLTKCLVGMLEENGNISAGEIYYGGLDVSKFKKNSEWLKIRGKRISIIFQDPLTSLNPLIKIGEQISEVIRLHRGVSKKQAKEEAIQILTRVGIPNAEQRYNDYPFQYSGGMRQRVVIAIALACQPDILICDEPTTALDVTIQAQILDLIKELKEEFGFTVIFITHDLGVVAEIADRVAVMYAGQIIEYGTAEDIFYDSKHPYTWALLSSLPQLGQKGEKLYSIEGTPPSLFEKPKGDAFAIRSEYALEIDLVKEPPMFKISDTHYAKTWLLDPRAPKVKRPKILDEIPERIAKIYSAVKTNPENSEKKGGDN